MKSTFSLTKPNFWFFTSKSSSISVFLILCSIISATSSEMMNGKLMASDRIKNEPESVWVEFIQLALEYKPLNLGQGFPDFPVPHFIIDSLHNATNLEDPSQWINNQYARSFGHPRLIKALVQYYNEFRGFKHLDDPNKQVLITVGAHEAIFASLMAFINPGDEVILLDPAYDAYAANVRLAQGKPVFVPLRFKSTNSNNNATMLSSSDFQLDMREFESKISPKTKVMVLNTPNNPLGKIYSRLELEAIAELCIKYNIMVISDEVYEQMYYSTSEPHVSIASLPGMWERTLTIGSAGKTFSVTGWKIGWIFGSKELMRYVQLVHQAAVYTVATPLQEATARAFEHEMNILRSNKTGFWEQELRADLRAKRDRMASILVKANMRPVLPQGGYFMVADFSHLAKQFPEYERDGEVEGRANTNDFRFARWLSRRKKLQGIPTSAFYSEENKPLANNLIRFCFIKQNATLDKMETLIGNLQSGEQQMEATGDSSSNKLPKPKL